MTSGAESQEHGPGLGRAAVRRKPANRPSSEATAVWKSFPQCIQVSLGQNRVMNEKGDLAALYERDF
jgi:hypothetical protein